MSGSVGKLSAQLTLNGNGFSRGLDDAKRQLRDVGNAVGNNPTEVVTSTGKDFGDRFGRAFSRSGDVASAFTKGGRGGLADLFSAGSGALGQQSGALGALGALGKGLGFLAGKALPVVGTVLAAGQAFSAMGDTVNSFVSKSSPALAREWERAGDDLTAALGKPLEGLGGWFTRQKRGFADFVMTLTTGEYKGPGQSTGLAQQYQAPQYSSAENLTRKSQLAAFDRALGSQQSQNEQGGFWDKVSNLAVGNFSIDWGKLFGSSAPSSDDIASVIARVAARQGLGKDACNQAGYP